MGRPPKSTEQHLREGTLRTYRHTDREPVRLADMPDTSTDPAVAALADVVAVMPPWITRTDAVALRLLAERLTLRADLRAQADAGDATARRDLLTLDRLIDNSLDALGLTTASRHRMNLTKPEPGAALAAFRAKHDKRSRPAPTKGNPA